MQRVRNLGLDIVEQGVRFPIRDRDSKYSGPFDEVLPQRRDPDHVDAGASAEGERDRGALRPDRGPSGRNGLLILNRRHLERVLRVYVDH